MRLFPDNYYLDTLSTTVEFDAIQSEYLDIDRLATGKCYGHIRYIITKDNNRKVIILNTPKLYQYDLSHINALLNHGFRVFQVLNNQLRPIETLDQVAMITEECISEKELKVLLGKSLRIEYHETVVLDYQQFQQYFEKDSFMAFNLIFTLPETLNTLSPSTCISIKDKNFLENSQKELIEKVLKKTNRIALKAEYELKKTEGIEGIEEPIHYINTIAEPLHDKKIITLYFTYNPNNIGYQLLKFPQLNLASVKTVNCNIKKQTYAQECLQKIHERTPNITGLSLSLYRDADEAEVEPNVEVSCPYHFPHLKDVVILGEYPDIYFPFIEQHRLQLESLSFDSFYSEKIVSLELPRLRHLSTEVNREIEHIKQHKHLNSLLVQGVISDEKLVELLNALPELQELSLCIQEHPLESIKDLDAIIDCLTPLKNLKILKIFSSISGVLMGELLKASPALTTLSLTELDSITSDLPSLKPLTHLTNIYISHQTIKKMTTSNYFTLLSIAPNLLSPITWYPTISIDPSTPANPLTINLNYATILWIRPPFYSRDFEQLVKGCPQLKTLIFDLNHEEWEPYEGLDNVLKTLQLEKIILQNGILRNGMEDLAAILPHAQLSIIRNVKVPVDDSHQLIEELNVDNINDTLRVSVVESLNKTTVYTSPLSLSPSHKIVASVLTHLLTSIFEFYGHPRDLPTLHPDSGLYFDDFSLQSIQEDEKEPDIHAHKLSSYLHEDLQRLTLCGLKIVSYFEHCNAKHLTELSLFDIVISLKNLEMLLAIINHNHGRVSMKECNIQIDTAQSERAAEFFKNLQDKYHDIRWAQTGNVIQREETDIIYRADPEEIYTIHNKDPEKKREKSNELIRRFQEPPIPQNLANQADNPSVPWTWKEKSLSFQLKEYLKTKYGSTLDPNILTRIDMGICFSLCQLCARTLQAQSDIQKAIHQWGIVSSNPNENDLENLWHDVEYYYIRLIAPPYHQPLPYLDAHLLEQLKSQIPPLYLTNAWHATLLWFDQANNRWIFYDPRRENSDPRIYADDTHGREALCQHLREEALGLAINIESDFPLTLTTFFQNAEQCCQFIMHGGLEGLEYDDLGRRFYEQIFIYWNNREIPDRVLSNGLFLLSTTQKPFWYKQLESFPKETIQLLNAASKQQEWEKSWVLLSKKEQETTRRVLARYDATLLLSYIPQQANCMPEKPPLTSPNVSPEMLKPVLNKPQINTAPLNPYMTKTIEVRNPIRPLYLQDLGILEEKIKNTPPIQSSSLPLCENINAFDEKAISYATTNQHTTHQQVLNNKLLQFDDEATLTHYIHHLIGQTRVQQRGFFVIHSLDDLKCAISHFKLDDHLRCHIDTAPSGAFHQFLQRHHDSEPIILINTSRFTQHELLTLNEFLGERKTDSHQHLPSKAVILTLQNLDSKGLYQGPDFISRHKDRLIMPSELGHTLALQKNFADIAPDDPTVFIVDFYHDPAWEKYIYGTLHLSSTEKVLSPSALFQALISAHPPTNIIFKNIPDIPACHYAITHFNQTGTLEYLQHRYQHPTPERLQIQCLKDRWAPAPDTQLTLIQGYPDTYDAVLNPETFSRCFSDHGHEENYLITLPGLIAKHREKRPDQPFVLYLTRELPLSSWAKLIDFSHKKNCSLIIHIADDVAVPSELNGFISKKSVHPTAKKSPPKNIDCIKTNDTRLATKDLLKEHPNSLVIDIDEITYSDLFYRRTLTLEEHGVKQHETKSQLWEALQTGGTVILRGKCPPELADHLADFFREHGGLHHHGKTESYSGKLIIVMPESDHTLSQYLPNAMIQQQHYDNPSVPALVMQMPDLPPELPNCDDLSEETSQRFVNQQKEAVENALTKKILTLLGHTSAGKSSFMHHLNETDASKQIFFGENNILPWIKANDPNKKYILFIDEANLTGTDWSIFKTLFDEPPHIFYNGKYYPLTDQHCVVFAGNPTSYRGRAIPSLFQENPNEVVFHPAPPAYLYHHVILPIIGKIPESHAIGQLFLNVYYFLKQQNIALTSRELQNLAFELAIAPSRNPLEQAKYLAYTMARQHMANNSHNGNSEKDQEGFQRWFSDNYTAAPAAPPPRDYPEKINNFSLTPSRYDLYDRIQKLLDTRSFKQNATDTRATYGGLSGAILEGPPGVGKTFFLKSHLIDQGFVERHLVDILNQKPLPENKNVFYSIPQGMRIEEKKKLLLQAFDEGAVVIMDEFNTQELPVLERLLNALLMGEDLEGNRAKTPGFTLFAAQNPESMGGCRINPSRALKNRLFSVTVPEYPVHEMWTIFTNMGLKEHQIYKILRNHLTQKATEHPLTFRELVSHAHCLCNSPSPPPASTTLTLKEPLAWLLEQLTPEEAQNNACVEQLLSLPDFNSLLHYRCENGQKNIDWKEPYATKFKSTPLSMLLDQLDQLDHLENDKKTVNSSTINVAPPKKTEKEKANFFRQITNSAQYLSHLFFPPATSSIKKEQAKETIGPVPLQKNHSVGQKK